MPGILTYIHVPMYLYLLRSVYVVSWVRVMTFRVLIHNNARTFWSQVLSFGSVLHFDDFASNLLTGVLIHISSSSHFFNWTMGWFSKKKSSSKLPSTADDSIAPTQSTGETSMVSPLRQLLDGKYIRPSCDFYWIFSTRPVI